MSDKTIVDGLYKGLLHAFADWPNPDVPSVPGVYTIWDTQGNFVYVGMAGRNKSRIQVRAMRAHGDKGLRNRLKYHASGQRSGDKFCIYVADRFLLPGLDRETISGIGNGDISLDALTKEYIRKNLSYRYIETRDGIEAQEVEREIIQGETPCGIPVLNARPGKMNRNG